MDFHTVLHEATNEFHLDGRIFRTLRVLASRPGQRVVWVLMPVAALLTFVFYRSQPHFIAHLYYAVHAHSFVFLMGTVALLVVRFGRVGDVLASA